MCCSNTPYLRVYFCAGWHYFLPVRTYFCIFSLQGFFAAVDVFFLSFFTFLVFVGVFSLFFFF